MKRSTKVSLVLLGSAAALTTLSGCDNQPQAPADNGGTFTTMAECVAVYDQQTCQSAMSLANQEHWQNAPHFSSYDQCVAQYGPGGCASGSTYGGSGNIWVPMMMGYMLGSANSTPAPLYYAPYAYRHAGQSGYSAPIFTSGRGYSHSSPIGAAPFASVRTTPGSLKSSTAISTGTVSVAPRGGFGSSFKPTTTFKQSYATTNPSSFGRSVMPATSTTYKSVVSSSRSYSSVSEGSHSYSSRGGFGSMGRSFGGGFGG